MSFCAWPLAVLRPRILASRHDQYATWFVLLARTLSTTCENRADDASQEVALRLHFAAARQQFSLAILHLNYMVRARARSSRSNQLVVDVGPCRRKLVAQ